jgi:hypothetical protein
MDAYSQQLAIEAATVGAAFIPWTYVVSGVMRTNRPHMITLFVAGASFHLMAELTGLNSYYLEHSAAQMLREKRWLVRNKNKPKKKKKCGIQFCGR